MMMGDIYRLSSTVFAYLGNGLDCTMPAKKRKQPNQPPVSNPVHFTGTLHDRGLVDPFLETKWSSTQLSVPAHRHSNKGGQRQLECLLSVVCLGPEHSPLRHSLASPLYHTDVDDDLERLNVFEALRRMMHSPSAPWRYRIWVVQEVVLPPSITVVFGHISAPWDILASAAQNYQDHTYKCCVETARHVPREYSKVMSDFSRRILDIHELRSVFPNSASIASSAVQSQRTLFSLLSRFRSRKATDPRDKVYALLALAHNTTLEPNYYIDTPEVFTQAALESIRSTKSLSILATSELGRKFRQDLPSWVPDWGAPGDSTELERAEVTELYDATAVQRFCCEIRHSKHRVWDDRYYHFSDWEEDALAISQPQQPKSSDEPEDVRPTYGPVVPDNKVLRVMAISLGRVHWVGDAMRGESVGISRRTLYRWIQDITSHKLTSPEDRPSLIFESRRTILTELELRKTCPLWSIFCADNLRGPNDTRNPGRFQRVASEDEETFYDWACTA